MTNYRRKLWLALAWATLATVGMNEAVGQAQVADSSPCAAMKLRLSWVLAEGSGKTPLIQLQNLLQFLAASPDDPEDCVRSDARSKSAELERGMVTLEAGAQSFPPDKVLYCNKVDQLSTHCSGPDLDDTPLVPEPKLAIKLRSKVPNVDTAALMMASGYNAQIVGTYGGATTDLQNGKLPFNVPRHSNTLDLRGLNKITDPVLIVLVQRKDSLAFRKFVWFLWPRQP